MGTMILVKRLLTGVISVKAEQALLVDTWMHLPAVSDETAQLIVAAIEQSASVISRGGIETLPLGVLLRLIHLAEGVPRSHGTDRFTKALNHAASTFLNRRSGHRGSAVLRLETVPDELCATVMPFLFNRMHQPVLSTLFADWLHSTRNDNGALRSNSTIESGGSGPSLDDAMDEDTSDRTVEQWLNSSSQSARFALHMLSDLSDGMSDESSDRDGLESRLMGFLYDCAAGSTDLLQEISVHGVHILRRILARSPDQVSTSSAGGRALQILSLSLEDSSKRGDACTTTRFFGEHRVPVLGAVANVFCATMACVSPPESPITAAQCTTAARCAQCLFLLVELTRTASSAVVVALRPGADGAVGSLHCALYKLLRQCCDGEECCDSEECRGCDSVAAAGAVANVISLFEALLQADSDYYLRRRQSDTEHGMQPSRCCLHLEDADDLCLASDLLKFQQPTVCALACAWLATSCRLRRERDAGPAAGAGDGTERGRPSADFSALHLQLLNQVMLCNAHATPFVGLSAAACLEEVYHTDSVGASSAAGLIRGWPTHVARMSRDLLVSNIGRSHSEQNPRSFAGQSVAEDIEAKELAATSGERSKEVDKSVADPIRGMTAEDGQFELREMALARVLGAVINRWPAIAPELLTPADCVATLRYIAKHNADPLRQTSFVNLVAAFAEQQLVPPAEQQECRACLCKLEQLMATDLSDAYGAGGDGEPMPALVWGAPPSTHPPCLCAWLSLGSCLQSCCAATHSRCRCPSPAFAAAVWMCSSGICVSVRRRRVESWKWRGRKCGDMLSQKHLHCHNFAVSLQICTAFSSIPSSSSTSASIRLCATCSRLLEPSSTEDIAGVE